MTEEQYEFENDYLLNNLTALAIVKAHTFSQEYNPTYGIVEDRPNYHALKEGYTAGFLAGFVYKLTGDIDL